MPIHRPDDNPDDIGLEAEGLREAAHAAGIATDVVEADWRGRRVSWLRLRFGDRTYCFRRGIHVHGTGDDARPLGPYVNGLAPRVTSNKAVTKDRLRAAGVPTPEGRLFATGEQDAAVAYGLALGGLVCIKPNAGWSGWYVYPGLVRAPQMVAAFRKARRFERGVLVERSVPGEVLRCFYLAPGCVAAKLNRRPSVLGDGAATIAELIERRNAEHAARNIPIQPPIDHGPDLRRALSAQAMDLATVPRAGQSILLGHVSNIRRGADAHDGIAQTHPSYRAVAEAACRAFGDLKIGAVDLMVTDPTQPAAAGNHWVLEVNSFPGFMDFRFQRTGQTQDVAGMIISFLQKNMT